MSANDEKDGSRRETLFEFIRRAFQDGSGAEPGADEQEPDGLHDPSAGEEPKSKARLEDGACHADGE